VTEYLVKWRGYSEEQHVIRVISTLGVGWECRASQEPRASAKVSNAHTV